MHARAGEQVPARTRAHRFPGGPALAVAVVALAALSLAAAVGGAFAATALGDPGVVTRSAAPAVRVLGHLALALAVGALLCVVTLLPAGQGTTPEASRRRALNLAAGAAGAWALLGAARIVLDYAVVVGIPPGAPGFGAQLGLFVTEVTLGRLLLAVALIAAAAATLAVAVTGATGAAWTLAGLGVAVGLLAQTGHAAGARDHTLAVTAMTLHIAAVAAWVGPLLALAVLRRRLPAAATTAGLHRFSVIALWAFLGVAVSGSVSGFVRLGGPAGAAALATPYGRLLAAKALLLLALGAVGYLHRTRTLPRLADRPALFWRLAAVELAVMGAVTGVAVALAGTPPPGGHVATPAPTPVEAVTGYPAPPEPTFLTWAGQWRLDLMFALAGVAMVVTYLRWAGRLRRRGDHWSAARAVSWVSGAAVLVWATSGAPAVYGHVLFSVHMFQHMVLALVAPILLSLGAPVTLALRALPRRRDGSRGPREWLLAVVESRWARFFANPVVAAVNVAASMVLFYYTPAFGLSLTSHVGHIAMVVHFSLAGYLFANGLVGIDPGPRRPPHAVRLLLLFATMAFHAFFGVALAQSTALLAPDWFGALGLPWGVDALADQQQGANLAWALGEVPTLVLAAVVALRWAGDEERLARRTDRAADRDGDAALVAYNAMLATLDRQDGAARPTRDGPAPQG